MAKGAFERHRVHYNGNGFLFGVRETQRDSWHFGGMLLV